MANVRPQKTNARKSCGGSSSSRCQSVSRQPHVLSKISQHNSGGNLDGGPMKLAGSRSSRGRMVGIRLASFDLDDDRCDEPSNDVEELVDCSAEEVANEVGITLSRKPQVGIVDVNAKSSLYWASYPSRFFSIFKDSDSSGRIQIEAAEGNDLTNLEKAVRDGQLDGCKIMREGGQSGSSFRLVATKHLQPNSVLGVDTGVLRTIHEMKEDPSLMKALFTTAIPAELLKVVGYQGPSLVMDCTEQGNEFNHANDYSEYWAVS